MEHSYLLTSSIYTDIVPLLGRLPYIKEDVLNDWLTDWLIHNQGTAKRIRGEAGLRERVGKRELLIIFKSMTL